MSPADLAKKWQCNPDTIRTWVRKAGKVLPKSYKKSNYRDIEVTESQRGSPHEGSIASIGYVVVAEAFFAQSSNVSVVDSFPRSNTFSQGGSGF